MDAREWLVCRQGLQLAPDGTVSGTPAVPGRFAFVHRVTDGEGRVATVNGTLVVAPKLAIKTVETEAGQGRRRLPRDDHDGREALRRQRGASAGSFQRA